MKQLLLVVLIIFLSFQTLILIKQPLLGWDESVYVGMAKYVASSGNIGLWEDLRPLGLPLSISSLWVFSSNNQTNIIFSKIVMITFAFLTILMTYFLAQKLFDKKTALAAATILTITPLFVFNSQLIHTEILSTLLGLIALYFFTDKKYYVVGIFAGLAFLTKFPQGILLIAFSTTLFFLKQKKDILKVVAGFFIFALPFFIFNFVVYGNILHTIIAATPHQNNPTFSVIDGTILSHVYNALYYPLELVKQNVFFIFVIPALFGIKNKTKNPLIGVALLFVIYFSIALNKQIRFALLFLPYLSIFAAQGILLTKKKQLAGVCMIFLATFSYLSYSEYSTLKTADEPIREFYTFFDKLQGSVLTANPVPAAYSDKLFIPFYQDVETAHKIYDTNKNVSTVAYTTEFYPCSNYADIEACEERKKELVKKISNGRKKVYSIDYGQEYIIYSR